MWTKSEASQDFTALKDACIALDQRFAHWQDSRVTEFKPTAAGHVIRRQETAVRHWPGKVDTYFDLYVAGVWNIFRAARLLLIALIIKVSDSCDEYYIHTAKNMAKDILASIPYHLTDNLQVFLNEGREITKRGRSLGGLLLMHPLYIASEMPFLPEEIRANIRRCLLWIGENMGVGQAVMLARVRY